MICCRLSRAEIWPSVAIKIDNDKTELKLKWENCEVKIECSSVLLIDYQ